MEAEKELKPITVTDLLAAATGGAFLLTVSYGLGYSHVIGINVFQYFTVNDYFRQSVGWLAWFIAGSSIGLLIRHLIDRWGSKPEKIQAKALVDTHISSFVLGTSFLAPLSLTVVVGAACHVSLDQDFAVVL